MLDKVRTLIRKNAFQRHLTAWEDAAQDAHEMDLSQLRKLRGRARQLRNRLDHVAHIAEGRLALPLIGSNVIRKPDQTDWAFRPEIWSHPVTPSGLAALKRRTEVGNHAVISHDCNISELSFRQIRNTRPSDLAPFGLRIDVFRFDGSFLSLVLELPPEATTDLRRNHILRVDAEVETERPLGAFARLNIKCGPNVVQILREVTLDSSEVMFEFDLEQSDFSEERLEKIWLDLIFEDPEMNEINLREFTLTRRPRAEF